MGSYFGTVSNNNNIILNTNATINIDDTLLHYIKGNHVFITDQSFISDIQLINNRRNIYHIVSDSDYIETTLQINNIPDLSDSFWLFIANIQDGIACNKVDNAIYNTSNVLISDDDILIDPIGNYSNLVVYNEYIHGYMTANVIEVVNGCTICEWIYPANATAHYYNDISTVDAFIGKQFRLLYTVPNECKTISIRTLI